MNRTERSEKIRYNYKYFTRPDATLIHRILPINLMNIMRIINIYANTADEQLALTNCLKVTN